MPKHIGIIGYGTIGSYLFSRIHDDKDLEVAFVYDVDQEKLSCLDTSIVLKSMEEMKERRVDLVVEVAGYEWVRKVVLEFSDLLIVSAAAFAQEGLQERLDIIAKAYKTNYFIPHGAIIGLDGIRDGREIIDDIKITSITSGEGHSPDKTLTRRTVLYDGPTRKACELFPRNLNIHASLALNGLGFDKTHSTVITDPKSRFLRHIIEVKGQRLKWKLDVRGKPPPSRKRTAVYVPESVFQTAKRICIKEYGMMLI